MERHERHSRPNSNVNSPEESKGPNGQAMTPTNYSLASNGHPQPPYVDNYSQPSSSNPAELTPLGGSETPQFFNGINHPWPSGGAQLYETLDSFLQSSFPDPTYTASFLDPILWDDTQMYANAYQSGNGLR